jgi:hypothetical protein
VGDTALVLHGHFYQPPRENPWTEVVPTERSAAPFHDWNERITAECYRPNGWARIVDDHGLVVAIVDNYERLSFNIGPTLHAWLDEHHPDVSERILEADRARGRAIAQAYGHAILPLADDHDLRTHIRWGLADFRHRFGRDAAGMWLPETAVDERVLAALADEGVAFTILAPNQADVADGELDTRRAHRWHHPDRDDLGVDIVFYDGALSHDVAFGGVASQGLVERVTASAPDGGLVCIATDGETFGHHHKYADRGVAYALAVEAPRHGVDVPHLGDWLRDHPPDDEIAVRLSSWSCVHGVERWRSDCGCHTGGEPGWNQAWRAPLRAALDVLRDHAVAVMDTRGATLLRDPWAARDAYIGVLLGEVTLDAFAVEHVIGDITDALTLLEASRHALLMYTSCGWFFNDLAGLETLQILRYAARAMDLFREIGETAPVDAFLDVLAEAHSNDPDEGDGRRIWHRHVDSSRVEAQRVVAHLALAELLGDPDDVREVLGGFVVERDAAKRVDRGGLVACAGRVVLTHRRTRRRSEHAYGALHLGGLEVFGAARASTDREADLAAIDALVDAVSGGARITALLRQVIDAFGPDELGLEDALPDAANQIVATVADSLTDRFADAYKRLHSDHADTLHALALAGYELPDELRAPVELALRRELEGELAVLADETDPEAYRVARAIALDAHVEGVELDSPAARASLGRAVQRAVGAAIASRQGDAVERAVGMLRVVRELGVGVDLDPIQEAVYDALVSGTDAKPLLPVGLALGLAVDHLGL